MSLTNSFAGNVLVGNFLSLIPYQQRNPRLTLLPGVGVLIMLVYHLHKEIIWDGNGLGIPDWNPLGSGGFFDPI